MGKNSRLIPSLYSKAYRAIFCSAIMLAGFLCSRLFLSLGMMLFVVSALWGTSPRDWLKQRWWLLGLCWIAMYALSWFWTDDKQSWGQMLQVKLPIALLPLAFGMLPTLTARELRTFTACLFLTMTIGIIYSLSFLLHHTDLTQLYIQGQVLRTPVYGDHIRFSTAVAACVCWGACMYPLMGSKRNRILLLACLLLFTVYLHILAAKSGLVMLYLFFLCYFLRLLFTQRWKQLAIATIGIAALAAFAYSLPTVRNKVNSVRWGFEHFDEGKKNVKYSDVERILSYNIALKAIPTYWPLGVGTGDVHTAMDDGYHQYYPEKPADQRIALPHNQPLIVMLGTGILGLFFFTWWLLAPLSRIRRKGRVGFYFFAQWLMLLVTLMVEPTLEVQFGVFVYLFFLLWQRHVLLHPPVDEVAPAAGVPTL